MRGLVLYTLYHVQGAGALLVVMSILQKFSLLGMFNLDPFMIYWIGEFIVFSSVQVLLLLNLMQLRRLKILMHDLMTVEEKQE